MQTHKDLPVQFLISKKPLKASIVLASFGSSQGFNAPAFEVNIELDPNAPAPKYEKPLRYGKQPEIHHIFRPDPKSPPKVVSLVFGALVVAALPALFLGVSTSWLSDHLTQHVADLGDIVGLPRREPEAPACSL
jgi:oligosaccharyltransferase complex subunit delta (ribophorin II)